MWTTEQNQAITARGGTLLVSAAAGSGKTSVLVERVIGMLTDAENKCPADRLLIVTFTKAATAQMKNRISEALCPPCSAEPWGTLTCAVSRCFFRFARICTIDSFLQRFGAREFSRGSE